MLEIGTPVEIISKSVGVSLSQIQYRKGYIVKISNDGIYWEYYQELYYHVWPFESGNVGDHFLECDLINLNNNNLPEDLFEI